MALLGELFSGVPFSDFITLRSFQSSPVLQESLSYAMPDFFFGMINGNYCLLAGIKPFLSVVGNIVPFLDGVANC